MTLNEYNKQQEERRKRRDRFIKNEYKLNNNNIKKLYPFYKRKFIPNKDKEL